jgi:hypothetical protein
VVGRPSADPGVDPNGHDADLECDDDRRHRELAGHDDGADPRRVSPLEAVKYQIVIMFLIASGTALGTVGVVLLSSRRLFNSSHQLLCHFVKER